MTERLDQILHEVSTEQRFEQERQRELEALKRAAVAAVKLSRDARARIEAPEPQSLGGRSHADRNYKRRQATRVMKALQNRQGKVE